MNDGIKREVFSWGKSIAVALILAFVINRFLFTPVTVSGQSMDPTFTDEERVIIAKIHTIDRFDLIVFDSPVSDELFIKRVIGLPGDHIVMEDDQLYVNGTKYEEDYTEKNKEALYKGVRLTENFALDVPKGHYFVLGDNRQFSRDSRQFGSIEEQAIVGKVSLRISPLKSMGIPK